MRVQFGRPIGQFQGVKHRCADMLARTELARAAVWDAARAANDLDNGAGLAIAAAAALAFDAAFLNGKDCVQTLGGIGFTWEHDAHLYLRARSRCTSSRARPTSGACARREVQGGARRRLAVDLGPEAEAHRAEVRALLDEVKELSPHEQRERFARDGYLTPGWPRPWGRDAKALELLVIEEEFRAAKVTARQHRCGRVGAADTDRVRIARAAGAVDPADAARRDQLVPALQRAGRRLRPRGAATMRDARRRRLGAQRSEGVDVDGAGRPSGGSASRAPRPIARSTKASRASWST